MEIRDAFVLILCILFSLILMISTDKNQIGSFRSVALDLVGGVGQYIYYVQSYFDLAEENKTLRNQNAELAYKYMQIEDALLENIRLRKLLGFREKSQLNLTAAEVIGENPHNIVNGFLLNAGSDHGIYLSAPAVTAEGLVGKIVSVDNNRSVCQILLDPSSRVSAKIQRNRELGVIAWDGGNDLKLMYITKTIKVYVGDVIITSGISQIFPENIKIGVVVQVSLDKRGLFQEIVVQPSVNFNRLEEVQVQVKESKDGNG
jgi:rod shape-determining protein MreC